MTQTLTQSTRLLADNAWFFLFCFSFFAWQSGYSTCSNKRYRHVINNVTKVKSLGRMPIDERIRFWFRVRVRVVYVWIKTTPYLIHRFTMWTGNDFLPGFENVGWVTAMKLHQQYEKLCDEDQKVYCPCMCLLFIHVFTHRLKYICLFVCRKVFWLR